MERPADYPKLENYTPTRFMLPTSHYDEEKADRAVRFIEMLCHTKGEWSGQPFWLLGWEETIVRDIFGIIKEDGLRQFKTVFIEIPKKNYRVVRVHRNVSGMCSERNPLNCWETLKPCGLQRGDENPLRECGESRKNRTDGGEVKTPAAFYNGQSAAKPR